MFQKIQGIGNLTRDPQMRYLPDGRPVLNVSVACNESYVKNGETVKNTTFWDLAYFGDSAEKAAKLNYMKGDQVFFEGTPEFSTYQNNAGNTVIRCSVKFPHTLRVGSRKAQGDFHAAAPVEPVELASTDPEEVF